MSTQGLARLVDNLLDMSRLQAGALPTTARTVGVDDIVARTLDSIGPDSDLIAVSLPPDLPEISADTGLLERVLVNLLENALHHSPADTPPLITASQHLDRLEIRIIDRGAGLPKEDREQVFQPFQRLGDTSNTTGVGLGLALARGFTEAMEGTLTPEDTPGGGLTMVVSLPLAPEGASRSTSARADAAMADAALADAVHAQMHPAGTPPEQTETVGG